MGKALVVSVDLVSNILYLVVAVVIHRKPLQTFVFHHIMTSMPYNFEIGFHWIARLVLIMDCKTCYEESRRLDS